MKTHLKIPLMKFPNRAKGLNTKSLKMKTFLLILLCILAVTAGLSGLLLIFNPDGSVLKLPWDLLDNTPFKSYRDPGIILAFIVGGVNLIAVFYNLQKHPARYNWAIAGGIVVCGWITGQILFIQTLHWLHFVYLIIGILIILIAYQLKGKWAV